MVSKIFEKEFNPLVMSFVFSEFSVSLNPSVLSVLKRIPTSLIFRYYYKSV